MDFEFVKFNDFTVSTDISDVVQRFKVIQHHCERATEICQQARMRYQKWREYVDLCAEYKKLFGAMIKSFIDADSPDKLTRYNDRLVTLGEKIAAIQIELKGEPTPPDKPAPRATTTDQFDNKDNRIEAEVDFQAEVINKLERAKALFDQATKLCK